MILDAQNRLSWSNYTSIKVLLMVGVGGVAPDVTDLRQKLNVDDTSSDENTVKISVIIPPTPTINSTLIEV